MDIQPSNSCLYVDRLKERNRIGVWGFGNVSIGDTAIVARPRNEHLPGHVPMIPGFFEGLTRINESIVHIVDLREQLGSTSGETTLHRRVVVARTDHGLVGIIAEGTSGITDIDPGCIDPPSPLLKQTGLVKGVAKVGDRLIPLLEVQGVLDRSECAKGCAHE